VHCVVTVSCFCAVVHQAIRASPCLSAVNTNNVPRRHFSIHEYQAMDLLRDFNIAVPKYKVATDPDGAREIAEEFGIMQLHVSCLTEVFEQCSLLKKYHM